MPVPQRMIYFSVIGGWLLITPPSAMAGLGEYESVMAACVPEWRPFIRTRYRPHLAAGIVSYENSGGPFPPGAVIFDKQGISNSWEDLCRSTACD